MFASLFILGCSVGLLVFWVRCTCILLARNSPAQSQVNQAVATQFSFSGIGQQLAAGDTSPAFQQALERDAKCLLYLLDHVTGARRKSWEDRLLVWDYRLMRCWYALTRAAFPDQARRSLSAMAQTLELLSTRLVERAGLSENV